ncbi:PREDICTED: LOB domain-containing protein 22 [Tarenaya hassleriana]|uniref:LOB domain-containing protein 22 n=1 Tax=Tarenaya hassleriana TaxID=28532 RepID=UPI00053C1A17|nr:PREDICTED: LOB domain-containing protein 22 [Tarenaya hassleriana]
MPSAANSGGSTPVSTVTSSGNTSTSPACAACKYQRKKCSKNCLLAPHFPHDRQTQFINAHKLFGVSNITKMIKNMEESQRVLAMNNLILEADMRARDPVGGIYRVVHNLQQQIESTKADLDLVLQHLALFRGRPQETKEIYHGYGNLTEQQWHVLNDQNMQDQYMQQGFVMECTYDHYDNNEKKKPVVKVSSDEIRKQKGIAKRKSDMGLNQLLISS